MYVTLLNLGIRTLYFGSYQPINRFSHLNTEYDLFYITINNIKYGANYDFGSRCYRFDGQIFFTESEMYYYILTLYNII